MKYLIIAKPRQKLRVEQTEELLADAKKWLSTRLENGTLDCAYQFVPAGGMAIANYDDHQKLHFDLPTYPQFPNFKWKVKPIVDLMAIYDQMESMESS